MFSYIWPIVLVIFSNVIYNISTKSTPGNVSPFLSLGVTYLIGAAFCITAFMVTSRGESIIAELGKLNWTSFILGVSIVGLETGYIYLYRAGWDVSRGSIVSNICLAIILIFVGMLLYKETISPKTIIGILICLTGLVVINL